MVASVRIVRTGNQDYVQAVEYIQELSGRTSVRVIRSFGRANLENRLKAEQFVAEYDRLKQLAEEHARSGSSHTDDFLRTALAIFGLILGVAVVGSILDEVFRDNRRQRS